MQCPKCANVLLDNVQHCPYCGAEIEPQPQKAPACPPAGNPAPVQPEIIRQDSPQPQPGAGPSLVEIRSKLPDGAAEVPHSYSAGDGLKKPGFTLFSAKGRVKRLKYFYFYVFSFIAQVLMRAGINFAPAGPDGAWLLVFYYLIIFLLGALQIITVIKRFHDIGQPGQYALTLFVPFYNIYIAFKLLFKDSEYGINTHGPYERNSWYWQVPVTLLLLPVVYFGLTAGGVAQTLAAQNAEPLHYYNQSQQISMTFPAGWKEAKLEGYLTAAQDFNGSRLIALEMEETTDPSFSEYSEDAIQQMVSNVGKTEFLTDALGYHSWEVSGLASSRRTINGMEFILVDFVQTMDGDRYRHMYLFGCQDGKYITIQLIRSGSDAKDIALMLASVETLRVGDEATAEPTKWD